MGHLGADRVIQLARERFYQPKMESDIIHFETKACPCQARICNTRAVKNLCLVYLSITPPDLSMVLV